MEWWANKFQPRPDRFPKPVRSFRLMEWWANKKTFAHPTWLPGLCRYESLEIRFFSKIGFLERITYNDEHFAWKYLLRRSASRIIKYLRSEVLKPTFLTHYLEDIL